MVKKISLFFSPAVRKSPKIKGIGKILELHHAIINRGLANILANPALESIVGEQEEKLYDLDTAFDQAYRVESLVSVGPQDALVLYVNLFKKGQKEHFYSVTGAFCEHDKTTHILLTEKSNEFYKQTARTYFF